MGNGRFACTCLGVLGWPGGIIIFARRVICKIQSDLAFAITHIDIEVDIILALALGCEVLAILYRPALVAKAAKI
jgi:hypothetical protein